MKEEQLRKIKEDPLHPTIILMLMNNYNFNNEIEVYREIALHILLALFLVIIVVF